MMIDNLIKKFLPNCQIKILKIKKQINNMTNLNNPEAQINNNLINNDSNIPNTSGNNRVY